MIITPSSFEGVILKLNPFKAPAHIGAGAFFMPYSRPLLSQHLIHFLIFTTLKIPMIPIVV